MKRLWPMLLCLGSIVLFSIAIKEFLDTESAFSLYGQLLGGDGRTMGELDPTLSENCHFPTFLKERLGWIKEERSKDRIRFGFKESMFGLLAVGKDSDGTDIVLVALPLMLKYESYNSMDTIKKRRVRNTLALALAHESLHIEESRGNHLWQGGPFKDMIEEEMFVRAVVNENGAIPLLEKGEVLTRDEEDTAIMLASCSGKWTTCEPFRAWVTDLYKHHPHKN